MSEALYKKIGGKYVLVSDDDSLYLYLRDGFYLIHAYPYGRSLQRIDPDKAAVKAGIKLSFDAMIEAMREASTTQPEGKRPLSKKERKAFAAYKKIMGPDSMARFTVESVQGIISAGIDALEPNIKPSNTLPPF